MTEEERTTRLIRHLKYNRSIGADYLITDKDVDIIIKALEQQPSDCVSRAEVNKLYDEYRPRLATHVSEFGDKLKALPPVTPTFPKGATNGDMIKAMFPKDYIYIYDRSVSSWWNAPYKGAI